MKQFIIALLALLTVLFNVNNEVSAQEEFGGTVKYQKTTKFNFDSRDDQRWKDFIATLPKKGNYSYVLYFKNDVALYKHNPEEQEASTPGLQRAMHVQNMMNPPKPELKKVYYDIKKRQKLEEMEFMTRFFLIESEIEEKSWKLLNKTKKILDYTCMGAEMKIGEKTISAWFTSEIPISAGPDIFYGLPGLILLIETDGEISIVATSIELDLPEKEKTEKPGEGKKVTQEEFDKIVKEKVEEHKKNASNRRDNGVHGR